MVVGYLYLLFRGSSLCVPGSMCPQLKEGSMCPKSGDPQGRNQEFLEGVAIYRMYHMYVYVCMYISITITIIQFI